MTSVGLEEHVSFVHLQNRLPKKYRFEGNDEYVRTRLFEVGRMRLAAMNESGTSIQILSWGGRGADVLRGNKAVQFARDCNNAMYNAIRTSPNPKRFRAFAHLPTLQASAAVEELRRSVEKLNFVGAMIVGMQGIEFLDSDRFAPIFTEAERLNVPIYLHPGPPPKVVKDTYHYTTNRLNDKQARILSLAGYSWHSEIGLHVLRMCYAGVFERHPTLKLIIGHNGELLPTMFVRSDQMAKKLGMKPISDVLRKHIYVTVSGIFDMVAIKCAIDVFGIDHVCWSIDYPYVADSVRDANTFKKKVRSTMSKRDFNSIMYDNAKKFLNIV